MVTLGLYRLSGATDNTYPYVFCNPNPKINVTNKDRVFVLGNEIERGLIMDYSKKERVQQTQGPTSGVPGEKSGFEDKLGDPESSDTIFSNTKDFYGLKKPQQMSG